jgi:hypothetical protein
MARIKELERNVSILFSRNKIEKQMIDVYLRVIIPVMPRLKAGLPI